MSVESVLKETTYETYEIPTTLDGLIHILSFNKYCLSKEQVDELEQIVQELKEGEFKNGS